MYLLQTRTRSLVSAFALLALTACGGGDGSDLPSIQDFSATPLMVAPGGTSSLAWTVDDATSISIVDDAGTTLVSDASATGTMPTDALQATTKFTLKASNAEGEVTKSVTITVEAVGNAPTVAGFVASPTAIDPGATATLTWMTTNAMTVDVTEGGTSVVADGDANGSVMVMPTADTTYTLVAKGADGMTAMAMVTVTVNVPQGPTIVSFMANPTAVDPGASSELSWNVSDADTVSIVDEGGNSVYDGTDAMGTASVSPMGTTVYTLSATNGVGTETQVVTVTVNPPTGAAVDAFTSNPSTVMLGMSSDLSWMVQRATSVEIMAGGQVLNTDTAMMGTFTVTPTITTEYTLWARSPGGDAMAVTTVMVTAGAPVVTDFSATPNPVGVGASTTLSWSVIGADTVRVLNGSTELANTAMNVGNLPVTITSTMTVFTLEIANQTGGNTAQVIVVGHNQPAINDFSASPTALITATTTVTLTWDASDVQNLSATANGMPIAGFPAVANAMGLTDETGTFDIAVTGDTDFVLTVSNAAGSVTDTVSARTALVELEPNDTATAAVAATPGTPILGTISVGDEDWYAVAVPAGGWIRAFTHDGAGGCPFDTRIALTSTDGVTLLQENDDTTGLGRCSLIDPNKASARNLAAGTYYVMVRGFSRTTTTGSYELSIEVGSPACANSLLETGEFCDDGNTVSGDGCSATCGLEPIFMFSAPGAEQQDMGNLAVNTQIDSAVITVTAPSYFFAQTLTSTSPDDCNRDTRLTLLDGNGVVVGTDDSDGIGSCSLIEPNRDAWATLMPGTYYLTIEEDGRNSVVGSYFLEMFATPVGQCGNFVAEATEQCDDGNTIGGDGCDANCQIEAVGTYSAPGAPLTFAMQAIDPIGEQDVYVVNVTAETYLSVWTYEDAVAGTCPSDDNYLRLFDAAGLQIGTDDDGGPGFCAAFDGNDSFARLAPGTYFVQVEDLSNNDIIPRYDIVFEGVPVDVCGNGFVDGMGEVCDDGNTNGGDGCDATCQPEGVVFAESEPNGSTATADDFGLTAVGFVTAQGIVDLGNDQDFYVLTVPAGGADINVHTYSTLGNRASCNVDTEVFLYDSTGAELANNDDIGGGNFCSDLTVTGLTAGTYYVSVEYYSRNFDPSSPFPYIVDITLQ